MKKKIVAAALSVSLLFSLTTVSFADGEWWRPGFDFVYYHAPKIMELDQPEDSFHPYREVSRYEVADALWKFDNKPPVRATAKFVDVNNEAVSYVSNADIMNGVDRFHFDPDSPITREQMATIAYRFAKATGCDVQMPARVEMEFVDLYDISDYAYGAVAWATKTGLMTGTGEGFEPKSNLNRGQIALILKRLDEFIKSSPKTNERIEANENAPVNTASNKEAFVDNLGWLLRQTDSGVIETEYSLSGGKEFVRINFQDRSLKVNITGLSYAEIILVVMEEII